MTSGKCKKPAIARSKPVMSRILTSLKSPWATCGWSWPGSKCNRSAGIDFETAGLQLALALDRVLGGKSSQYGAVNPLGLGKSERVAGGVPAFQRLFKSRHPSRQSENFAEPLLSQALVAANNRDGQTHLPPNLLLTREKNWRIIESPWVPTKMHEPLILLAIVHVGAGEGELGVPRAASGKREVGGPPVSERIKGLGRGLGPGVRDWMACSGDACRFRHIRIRVDKGCHSQLVNHGCPSAAGP